MNFPDIKTPFGGFFALVSYVPEPLGPFLDQLRQSLPGAEFPQAHITLLPPRPLAVTIHAASRHAQSVLNRFSAFDVELSAVRKFPETKVLYLDLTDGGETVRDLHQALNSGDLHYKEPFEFHPHLTLGGPVPDATVGSVQQEAEILWRSFHVTRRFAVEEIVGLWASSNGIGLCWQRLWSYNLQPNQTRSATAGPIGQKL
ncbi:MAG: 2'-5' RNA ligase family protein [Acidobacteriota bacterium]|nr:2'-5' RNA ligase family protein [Acidobacteriota bacterium]